MSESGGEKTEAPTPKRKRKAADEGQILSSKDFGTALIVLLGCAWMAMLGPALIRACKEVMVGSFSFGRADIEDFEPWRPIAEAGWKLALPIGGLLLVAVAGAVLSHAGLAGLRWNAKLFAPKASRINPGSGLKRIFGPTGWIEMGKALLKVVLLGSIGTWLLWSLTRRSLGLVEADLHGAIGAMGGEFLMLLFVMAGGLMLIAGIDLPIQILRHMNRLRMTKQEVKDEHKESEGSPEAKAAQRQRQRQILKGGFRKAVETAHVVITNPTHFAVALRYEQGRDQVPVVVAKGRGATALAIRELAGELDVPILEYPQLARAVYYTSKENQEIRDDLYMAVATVLAFVFQVSSRAGAVQPAITVPETALFDENGLKQARTH
ncbi:MULTISPECIES: flagellar biosynthesis protein FlhB [Sphingomonas]|uniref:Flagellar biosynthetic protein FlhB n=1 Tax=Sphingomonas leidyi TaxID=68569 RepID=A0A7X5V113_9SPHN|nr:MULTISPECIES: flagellar type III secretion system protein FlhB [Sphingomonas]MBN8810001.1 flagellar biosynthesis protein FlhB [Sphingomonas sp.]NIJ65828.1 flagellar biosynthetic protein FlhB [Sphingomonas leidyi]OJY50593.1 MAG: flagellar biosynthesis protein FlhB [Sphingomonas sp. 67-41]